MALVGIGFSFFLVGAGIWAFPRLFRKELAFRGDYAAKLSAEGHYDRAKKIDAETEIITRRVPIYGKVLVGVGVCLIIVAAFTACGSPPAKPKKLSAQVVKITNAHDSYAGGGFKFFTVVTYQVLNSERTVERYFDIEAPELKALTVGRIVTLEE